MTITHTNQPALATTANGHVDTVAAVAAATTLLATLDNLPTFIGDGGALVPCEDGADGLWRTSRQLLADAVTYRRTSRAAYYRSRDYWPALVANQLLKVVS